MMRLPRPHRILTYSGACTKLLFMNFTERVLYVSGSPRSGGNTDYLLTALQAELSGTLIRLSDFRIEHCSSCWNCLDSGHCTMTDDMTAQVIPSLLKCDAEAIRSVQTLVARIQELLSVVNHPTRVGKLSQPHDRTKNE